MSTRKVLAANLSALMRRPDRPIVTERELSERARTRGYVVSPSSVNRIPNCKVAPTLDHVVILASLFELQPWQLLTPGLNPDDPPVLAAISDRLRDFQTALKTQADTIAALQNALKTGRRNFCRFCSVCGLTALRSWSRILPRCTNSSTEDAMALASLYDQSAALDSNGQPFVVGRIYCARIGACFEGLYEYVGPAVYALLASGDVGVEGDVEHYTKHEFACVDYNDSDEVVTADYADEWVLQS